MQRSYPGRPRRVLHKLASPAEEQGIT